jgi:RNA polymerase sigma factor (sigma-70 family)
VSALAGEGRTAVEDPVQHLPLVRSRAERFRGRWSGLDLEDLVQEGTLALLDACRLFRPELGFRFSTYAVRAIDSRLQRAIDRQGHTVRVPTHVRIRSRRIALARERLGPEATVEQLAEATTLTPAQVRQALLVASRKTIQLDGFAREDEEDRGSLAEVLAPELGPGPVTLAERRDLAGKLRAAFEWLQPRERRVLEAFYLEEWTAGQIASELCVSVQRVRQIKAQALEKARWALERPHDEELSRPSLTGT